MTHSTDLWTIAVIIGLAVVTVLTRSFFFISSKSWDLPLWAQRGLQYAPIATLAAGASWYFWRKGGGKLFWARFWSAWRYVPLHLGLGW